MDDTVNYSGSSHAAALICLASEPEAVMHRRWRQNSENQFGEIGLGFCGFFYSPRYQNLSMQQFGLLYGLKIEQSNHKKNVKTRDMYLETNSQMQNKLKQKKWKSEG